MIWEGRDFSFDCSQRSLIMGIVNVTPDSFSDGGHFFEKDKAVRQGIRLRDQGADILDIGGESTRPGSRPVSAQEEMDRVCPVIEGLASEVDVPISIDTYKSEVADQGIKSGAKIINDISGLRFDEKMPGVAVKHDAGLIIMHIKGTPRDMQKDPDYRNLFSEIIIYLEEGMSKAWEAGLERTRIALDPGIGFGKTLEHNLSIMGHLERFSIMRRPLLLGVSRKSFLGSITGEDVDNRLFGTAAAVAVCISKGAHILRVHDVKEMAEVSRVSDAIIRAENGAGQR